MKRYVPRWKKLPKSLRKDYEDGASILELSLKYKTGQHIIRQALTFQHTTMRPPGGVTGSPGLGRWNLKLSEDDLRDILQLDKDNIPHSEIARRISHKNRTISRERIRQICLAAGRATRSSRRIPKIEGIRASIIINKEIRKESVKKISEIWKSGGSYRDIALLLGNDKASNSFISNRISYLRHKHGKEMFPYRRKHHWQIIGIEKQAERLKSLAREWNRTADIWHIKKMFKYKSYSSAHASISRFRRKYPGLFLTPEKIMQEYINK